jgi:chemotaxis protein CheZ
MSDSHQYGRGQVIDIINSVITKIDSNVAQREIYAQIADLAQIIDDLKKQIASYDPQHVKNSHIPDATDELDEVVNATATATNIIMGLCEEIEQLANALDGQKGDDITAKVTQIYEACTFQDITGQRIKNVVTTLRTIEQKVDNIMKTLSDKVGLVTGDARLSKAISVDDEKSLLNGPQMADKAISQDDIDKLLAEFDK